MIVYRNSNSFWWGKRVNRSSKLLATGAWDNLMIDTIVKYSLYIPRYKISYLEDRNYLQVPLLSLLPSSDR